MFLTIRKITLILLLIVLIFGVSLLLAVHFKSRLTTVAYVNLGIWGTVLWVVSLLYVFRKYGLISWGHLKRWLQMHLWFGGGGYYFIVVHSDFHFRAWVPTADFIVMTIVIVTGLVGYFIYISALRELNTGLLANGKQQWQIEELEGELALQALAVKSMGWWRLIHRLFTIIALALTLVHGISVYFFRGFY